jgi:hypothetical protein
MSTQELPREEIARLAYQLWEERGCPVGSPEIDWERAEKALRYDAASDAGQQLQEEAADASAQSDDSNTSDGAAPKSSRRSPRASGRTNEGPRRSTQVR